MYPFDGEPTLFCCYAVDDIDAAIDRVRIAGGSAEPPTDEPFGRTANCVDDDGTPFALYQAPDSDVDGRAPLENGTRPGDLAYQTMLAIDSNRARAFYGSVLGWTFTPGRVADGWSVHDPVPMVGLSGGNERSIGVPMWRVDDIAIAVRRVREAGGTATEPSEQPYGITAECVDDQGSRFYLGQL
jgi:predicted enzyme related to lactoylglutathione lyase